MNMTENKIVANNGSSIVIYTTDDGNTQLEVKLEKETVWLNREQIAQLYGRDYKTIAKHINNALREELEGEPVVAKFATPKKYGRKEGYKRIAAMLFLWFMEKNGILYGLDGHKRIADNTLVALTLMIAESRTEEKDMMVKVVVNLINKDNQ